MKHARQAGGAFKPPKVKGRRSLAGLFVYTVEAFESAADRLGYYAPVCPQYATVPYCMDVANSTANACPFFEPRGPRATSRSPKPS